MDKVKQLCEKAVVWIKANKKTSIIALIVIIAIIIAIVLAGCISKNKNKKDESGPEAAVKGYISGMSNLDSEKMLKYYDAQGAVAWTDCSGNTAEFKDVYDDVEKDDIEYAEESIENSLEYYKDYKSFSMKVDDIKSVNEDEDCKNLYKVKTKVTITTKYDEDYEEDESTETITFVVYEDKVIAMEF